MILIAHVRLTSHFLGEMKPDHRGIRRFKLDSFGRAAVNQNQWLEDLVFAARSLKLDLKVTTTMVPPEGISMGTIHLHRRTYSGAKVDFFEAFLKNTILTFDLVLHDDRPKCPTIEDTRRMLEIVGQYRGISQWGSRFGFGRFKVLEVRDRFHIEGAETLDVEIANGLGAGSVVDSDSSVDPVSERAG